MCEKHEEDHSCCTVSAVCYQRVPTAVNSQLGQGPRSVVPAGATPDAHMHGTPTIGAARVCLPAATWTLLCISTDSAAGHHRLYETFVKGEPVAGQESVCASNRGGPETSI
jgi:hypothetical protein